MFNVLVIVALSAAVAAKNGASGVIDHRVVARDICFYTCSILLLVTSVNDDQIDWWEVRKPFRSRNCPVGISIQPSVAEKGENMYRAPRSSTTHRHRTTQALWT